jgi:hypothetical protein
MSTFDDEVNNNRGGPLIPLLEGWFHGDEQMKELYHHVCSLVEEAKDIYGNDTERKEKDLKALALFIKKKSRGVYDGGLSEFGRANEDVLCEQLQLYYNEHPHALEVDLSLTTIPVELKMMIVAALVDDINKDPGDRNALIETLNTLALVNSDMKALSESYYTNGGRVEGELLSKRDKTTHDFLVAIMGVGEQKYTFAGYSVLTALPRSRDNDRQRYMCSMQVREFTILAKDYAGKSSSSSSLELHSSPIDPNKTIRLFEVNFTNELTEILSDVLPVIKQNSIGVEDLNTIGKLQMEQNVTVISAIEYVRDREQDQDPYFAIERGYRMKPLQYDFTTTKNINEEGLWGSNYKRFYNVTRAQIKHIMREKIRNMVSVIGSRVNDVPEKRTMNQTSYVVTAPYLLAIFEHLCKIDAMDIFDNNTLFVFHPTFSLVDFSLDIDHTYRTVASNRIATDEDDGIDIVFTGSEYLDVPITDPHVEYEFNLVGPLQNSVSFNPADHLRFSPETEAHLASQNTQPHRPPVLGYMLTRSYLTRSDGVLFTRRDSGPELRVDDNMLGYTIHDGPLVSAAKNFLPLYRRGAWRKTLGGAPMIKMALREQLKTYDIIPANIYSTNKSNNNNNNNNTQ